MSGRGKAFEASEAGQVDAVEDHEELSRGHLDAVGVEVGLGEVVAAILQTLTPEAEAVAAPIENLDAVGTAVEEDEQVAGQGVGLEAVLDQGEQPVEARTHIDGIGAIPQLDGGGEAQHGLPPRRSTR